MPYYRPGRVGASDLLGARIFKGKTGGSEDIAPTRERSRTKILKLSGLDQVRCPWRPEASSDSLNNIIYPRVGRGLRSHETLAGIAWEQRRLLGS